MLRLAAAGLAGYVNRLAMSCVWGVFAERSRHAGSGASHHRFALMFAASPTGMSLPLGCLDLLSSVSFPQLPLLEHLFCSCHVTLSGYQQLAVIAALRQAKVFGNHLFAVEVVGWVKFN